MDYHVELEEARREDIPVLAGFLGDLFLLEDDFSSNPEHQKEALECAFANPQHVRVYLIKANGKTAGMVALHLAISTAEGGWCGRIEDFYICPEFRRRGIGRQVVEKLTAMASNNGLTRVTLVADKGNTPALNFYSACGFTEMNLISLIKHL